MLMDWVFWSVFGIVAVGFIGYVAWRKYKQAHPMDRWVHCGLAIPPQAELAAAMATIKTEMAALGWKGPWGGIVEWTTKPYMIDGIMAAGHVVELDTPRLRVVAFPRIKDCALVHEINHIRWYRAGRKKIGDGDPAFYAEVNAINSKIF